MRTIPIALGCILLLTAATATAAQEEYGRVELATSCAEEVQPVFNEGAALLHHMMYEQAESRFQRVAEGDPECAMAHWGVAMTQLHPLWAPPTEAELERGSRAAARAEAVGAPTERERAYILAVRAFFDTEGTFAERLEAWESAQTDLHAEYPDDVDAAAFHALARLATARPDDATFARQEEAGALLDRLRQTHPRHPGLFHYAIHAYDNPVLAERGLEAARRYDRIAPEVPHALHMPSHVFVRLGMWEDVAEWNRRSADAALEHAVGGQTPMHFVHAMDYLVYARLQQGRDEAVAAALDDLVRAGPFQPHLATAYGLAAPPARRALERRAWAEAAELAVDRPASFPWDRFPAAHSLTWFAKGLGSARSGDEAAARAAIDRLDRLHAALKEADASYWAIHTDAQRKAVAAWIHFENGRVDEALRLMREAADLEDSVDKHPTTPSPVVPAREILGEMLLLADRPAEARKAFAASLDVSPGRLNSLSGAARAAELTGDREAAARYYRRVAEMAAPTADRPRMAKTRAFLNGS